LEFRKVDFQQRATIMNPSFDLTVWPLLLLFDNSYSPQWFT